MSWRRHPPAAVDRTSAFGERLASSTRRQIRFRATITDAMGQCSFSASSTLGNGHPVFAWSRCLERCCSATGRPHDYADSRSRGAGGRDQYRIQHKRHIELVNDAAVIALAERAHREAFPNFPVLAFDIIRDAETGSLYVLECHAGGTWMFSADAGLGIEAANNLDFRRQFDAIDKAAAILARETPLRAAVCWPIATRSWPGGLHN
jgi:hypothetical protein